MRILTINMCLDGALSDMGHEVLGLSLPAGVHTLLSQPGVRVFQPDLLIQQEALGNATLLLDLGNFSCPKAFWSLDTHLNLFWHRHYGRLFDSFLTPHTDFCGEAPPHWQHPYTRRLPFVALPVPWRDHATRAHTVNFVGRITPQRPLRERVIQFLQQRYGMGVYQDISRAEMLALYEDTRILPNETIAFESNFRLLEGASCGCCLISPHIGEDQDAVLEAGKEVLVYSDALECMELIDLCLHKPHIAEAVGRMAWERVQAAHLPQHRATQLLQAVADAPASALCGAQTHECLWCCAAELELAGTFFSSPEQPVWNCDVYGTPTTIALRMRNAQQQQNMQQCAALLQEALHILPQAPLHAMAPEAQQQGTGQHKDQQWAGHEHAGACMAEAATTMALQCLERDDLAMAHLFTRRLYYCLGQTPPPLTPDSAVPRGEQATTLAQLWAEKLYTGYGHWYAALEFLIFVSKRDGLNSAWAEQWMRLRPVVRHFPLLALSGLARLSLNNEDDISLHAAYIAVNLRCFRLVEAQEEVAACTARWRGSPKEAQWHKALRAQCQNIHSLGEALQVFS